MTMAENKEIGLVEVQDNQILFTDKDNSTVYKTGIMNDPDLLDGLVDSGAIFSRGIVEEVSPLTSLLVYRLLPMLIFIGIGQYMSKKLMNKGGGNSMMFGIGGSTAKVYVKSSDSPHY